MMRLPKSWNLGCAAYCKNHKNLLKSERKDAGLWCKPFVSEMYQYHWFYEGFRRNCNCCDKS